MALHTCQILLDTCSSLLMVFCNLLALLLYTAFSDKIQFTEAPELGASFTGFYVGKLRQLDDISFEFDSLRQSFNLKRNDSFYSLTLTDGAENLPPFAQRITSLFLLTVFFRNLVLVLRSLVLGLSSQRFLALDPHL